MGSDLYRHISQRLSARAPARILLVGPGGSGKTSLVHRLAYDFQQGSHGTVVMISEADILNLGVVQAIQRYVGTEHRLDLGGLLVLDGIDTLPLASTDPEPLRTAAELAGRAHVVVTGRHIDRRTDQEAAARSGFKTYVIGGWTQADIRHALTVAGLTNDDLGRLLPVLYQQRATYPRDVMLAAHAYMRNGLPGVQATLASQEHLRAPDLMLVPNVSGRLQLLASVRLPVTDIAVGQQTVQAAPLLPLAAARWRYSAELRELEALINDRDTSEHALQQFFERNPRFLAGVEYDEVVPHPLLVREDDGPLIPDFMLAPTAGAADILDLKLPGVSLTAGTKDRKRMSRHVADAVAQLREYGAYFDTPAGREHFRAQYRLHAYRPRLTVVIGRTPPQSDPLQLRRLWNDLPHKTNVLTYDELLARARRLEHARGF